MEPIEIVDRGRGPQLARTRITVYDVYHYMEHGRDAEYIASVLPISVEEVHALQHYIREHLEEVLEVHRQIEARNARGNPPEVEEILRKSPWRAKLRAKWDEIHAKRRSQANGQGASPGHQCEGTSETSNPFA